MNIKKTTKNIIKCSLLILLTIFIYGIYQHVKVNTMITDFKSRSEVEEIKTVVFPNGTYEERMYHPIDRVNDNELSDKRDVFFDDVDHLYLGKKGDVFVTQESPFPNIFGFHQLMSFFVGGHAALNNGNNQFIEATGFPQADERIIDIIKDESEGTHDFSVGVNQSATNYWMLPDYRGENDPSYPYYGSYYREKFIVLRVKNLEEETLNKTMEYANKHLMNRSLYNFLFFLDTHNKFYCTDFISRSYRYGMQNENSDISYPLTLNDNGFVTTVNDLILSDDTYITAYVENRDNIRHIYYLSDVT
ncbi:hypothetical protein BK010_09415 [Tenericutes bacterium MO-XQ]|nr:hypothetical protein BK010_09415 [Tenericutes bacterium MO-XQ]